MKDEVAALLALYRSQLISELRAAEAQIAALTARVEGLTGALHNCVGMLDCLVAESGRSIEWGQEDPFRMGKWFEPDDLKQLAQARAALSATTDAAHVNETPKSEHDAGNVLTDAALIARLREIQGQAGLFASAAADLITALLARIAAMEAQIKGLEGGIEAACDREAETERKLRTALAASETRAEAAETALVAERAKTAKLVEAGRALQADMLERARIGTDAIHGEEYRIVNAGRTAWADFCAALSATTEEGHE